MEDGAHGAHRPVQAGRAPALRPLSPCRSLHHAGPDRSEDTDPRHGPRRASATGMVGPAPRPSPDPQGLHFAPRPPGLDRAPGPAGRHGRPVPRARHRLPGFGRARARQQRQGALDRGADASRPHHDIVNGKERRANAADTRAIREWTLRLLADEAAPPDALWASVADRPPRCWAVFLAAEGCALAIQKRLDKLAAWSRLSP